MKGKVIDKLKAIASNRYYSRTYLEGALKPGDHVLMSLACTAPDFQTGQRMKDGTHKSYLPQWDISQVYGVEKPWGTNAYRIKTIEGEHVNGDWDRTSLLNIPKASLLSKLSPEETKPPFQPHAFLYRVIFTAGPVHLAAPSDHHDMRLHIAACSPPSSTFANQVSNVLSFPCPEGSPSRGRRCLTPSYLSPYVLICPRKLL